MPVSAEQLQAFAAKYPPKEQESTKPVSQLKDITGLRFGRLVVVERRPRKNRRTYWKCRCDCSKTKTIYASNLMKGATKSCGCLRNEQIRKAIGKRPYESLFNLLKRSSTRPVSISYEQFLIFTHTRNCHYCGARVFWTKFNIGKPENGAAYNLDRKDNNLPYSFPNLVVCCKCCNLSKGNRFTYDEWRKIGSLIRSWRENAR